MAHSDRPRRPRSHEIETASEKAFVQVIPDGWVVRPKAHDYGIDLEVEIFDDEGCATGHVFLVQLKGTDDASESVRVPMALATLAYMADLRLPVLIVRYRATDSALFGRWAHTVEIPHSKRSQETITVAFGTVHSLGADSSPALAAAATDYRKFFVDRSLPLYLALELSEDFFESRAAGDLQRALKTNVVQLSPLVQLDTTTDHRGSATPSALVVEATRIEVLVVGRRVLEMSVTSRPTAADVMTAIAIALAGGGFEADVATLLDGVFESSQFATRNDIETIRWRCLLAAGRTVDALSRIERCALGCYAADVDDSAVGSGLLALIDRARHDRAFSHDRLAPTLDRLAAALIDAGHHARAAPLVYNSANLLKSCKRADLRQAIARYRRAARLDPAYLQRDYWWAELGGSLFEARRYRAASDCYERALGLGMGGRVLALAADAQWHCGRYRSAISNFDAYFADLSASADPGARAGSAGWCLTRWALSSAVEMLGLESGPLHTGMDRYRGDNDPQSLLDYLRDHGILHPRIWFNYASASSSGGDHEGALIGFLMAALLEPADKEAWSNAFALAVNANDGELVAHLIDEVSFRHGSEFFDDFVDSRIPGATEETRTVRRQLRRALMASGNASSSLGATMEVRVNGRSLPDRGERPAPAGDLKSSALPCKP